MTDPKRGTPVDAEEVWYRRILTPSEVTNEPAPDRKLNPKFFEEKFTPGTDPDWKHEISGRLVSKAGSIVGDAQAAVARLQGMKRNNIAFYGVIASSAESVRNIPPGCFDVRSTPSRADQAHADLVSTEDLKVKGVFSLKKTRGLRSHFRLLTVGAEGFPVAPGIPGAEESET